jgi:branched-chain amino acid transport system substrate-binding protein
VADAMQRAGSIESAKYLPEMIKTKHDGVTAPIAFDDKGDLTGGAITVYRIEKGEWKMLKTIGGSQSPTPATTAAPAK